MPWWEAGLRMLLAVIVGVCIGVERERKNRPAGMRTHVLVCLGAAVIAILDAELVKRSLEINMANPSSGVSVTMGRITAQVVSGIGFLGAGTIFMSQKKIGGLTTAASLWATGCLGLAAGWGFYALTISGCVIVLVTLTMLRQVVHVNAIKCVEVKFIHRTDTLNFINKYFEESGITVLDVNFQVDNTHEHNLYTNIYVLNMPTTMSYTDIVNYLSEYANIQGVRTRNT